MTEKIYSFDINKDPPKMIEVPMDHILYGDTDSVGIDASSIFDEDANVDEVVSFGDAVAEMINEQYPDFLKSVFNVPDDNTHWIKTERETVFSRAFFQSKKKYFQYIVDDEGERVNNKEKIMGLEIKKTSSSNVTREYLYKLCKCILDIGTRDAALDLIEDFKRDFRTRSLEDIATPTSVKTLYKYAKGDKKIPVGVQAAMNYNDLRDINDPEIRSGDKVKFFYVKDSDGIKSLAFPVDVDRVPEFVYNYTVDWDKEWEKVFKSLNNYLESMEWDQSSYRVNHTNNLFSVE